MKDLKGIFDEDLLTKLQKIYEPKDLGVILEALAIYSITKEEVKLPKKFQANFEILKYSVDLKETITNTKSKTASRVSKCRAHKLESKEKTQDKLVIKATEEMEVCQDLPCHSETEVCKKVENEIGSELPLPSAVNPHPEPEVQECIISNNECNATDYSDEAILQRLLKELYELSKTDEYKRTHVKKEYNLKPLNYNIKPSVPNNRNQWVNKGYNHKNYNKNNYKNCSYA